MKIDVNFIQQSFGMGVAPKLNRLVEICEKKLFSQDATNLFLQVEDGPSGKLITPFLFFKDHVLIVKDFGSASAEAETMNYENFLLRGNIDYFNLQVRNFNLERGEARDNSHLRLELHLNGKKLILSADGTNCENLYGILKQSIITNMQE